MINHKDRTDFTLIMRVTTEQQDGYWTARAVDLGFTVFADTEMDAIARVDKALDVWTANYFQDKPSLFRRFLDGHDVAYSAVDHLAIPSEHSMSKRLSLVAPWPMGTTHKSGSSVRFSMK